MTTTDDTHHPALTSWVASANDPHTDFPVQNLPYGRFRRRASGEAWRIGVAIGDQVLDLKLAVAAPGWSRDEAALLQPLADGDLNEFMAQPTAMRELLRSALSRALRTGSTARQALAACLVAQSEVEMTTPCRIGDYTDFYAGIHHATTVGKLFRPDNPLMPNYKWVPIGYHGRASSIGASGQQFRRPRGQAMPPGATSPSVGPSRRLDYELEMAAFIATPNALGEPVGIAQAEDHLFGLALFNDWSARDIQAWEYQPLGPFLAKNFASVVSPWIVTMQALKPFRAPFERPAGDPAPLPYLDSDANRSQGMIDITLEVALQTQAMREAATAPQRLSRSNLRDAYWTVAQLVAHHTVNGCNLQSGDLLGTGTLSGLRPDQAGSLLELSDGGKKPITLANGETRTFLEDGDTVIFKGWCEREGARRIGLGECRGTVLPALSAG
jgi:fumarylacetoacetase